MKRHPRERTFRVRNVRRMRFSYAAFLEINVELYFDDNDHKDNTYYTYTVKGHLLYQKDFTDKNGVAHKKGDAVQTTKGTQDTVVITSDVSGNISFTYADGSKANGKMTNKKYSMAKER